MGYNAKNSIMFRSVDDSRLIPVGLFMVLKGLAAVVFWVSAFALALRFAVGMMPAGLAKPLSFFGANARGNLFEGLAWLSFSVWAYSALILGFFRQKLARQGKNLREIMPANANLLDYLDFEAARTVKSVLKSGQGRFSTRLLLAIVKSGRLAFTLSRLGIKRGEFEKLIAAAAKSGAPVADNSGLVETVLQNSARLALKNDETKISLFILLAALARIEPCFKEILDKFGVQEEDVESTALWQQRTEIYRQFRNKFWERDNLRLSLAASPARDLVGGYTITLDKYSRDLSLSSPLRAGGVVLHQEQIDQLGEVLAKRTGSGVLLVGEIGSGRKSIVYNFANRVASENGPARLKMLRILELDMVTLIANNPDKAGLAAELENIFEEAVRARNVVLVIPQIHNYIGGQFGAEKLASIDISGVIGGYLKTPGFRIVGITTYEGLHCSIEKSAEAAPLFAKIEVPPVSGDDALRVLKEESLRREKSGGLMIPIAALKEIVKLCDYFLGGRAFPEKAVTLLDDIVSGKLNRPGKTGRAVTADEVDTFFSHKYDVPAGAAGDREKETLLNLESLIHEGLINQKEAVAELANALRRSRAEIKAGKRTIGNFLFLGPTGCGKTETAKQLARVYFGSEKNIIRLDMAEYQTSDSITRLVGDSQTPGILTSAARDNPFSLILVDEIEKASPELLNLFLSVFDEGELADGTGRIVDFRHAIIIATSNAGAEIIRQEIDAKGGLSPDFKKEFIDKLLRQNIFRPEFINRFDASVLYRPLVQTEIEQVADLMLADIREGLRQKRVELQVTPELTAELGRLGFDPVFGARAMRRVVQDKVENAIARSLLSDAIRAGDVITIDPQTWQVVIAGKTAGEGKDQ